MKNLRLFNKWTMLLIALLFTFSCTDDEEPTLGEPPVADAGTDINAFVDSEVTLNGSNSSDPEGGALTFSWELTQSPSGSSTTISNASSEQATFIPDVAGDFTATLTVEDGDGNSDTDNVLINATVNENEAPQAVITDSNNQSIAPENDNDVVNVGNTIQLSGVNSSDPEGDDLTYLWEITSAPSGSDPTLANEETEVLDFTPDVEGEYTISLTVDDGNGNESSEEVTIEAEVSPVEIGGNYNEDTILEDIYDDPSLPDYRVMSNLGINSGFVLTIEPGVTVEFTSSTRLEVDGRLVAEGTSEDSIKFTGVTKAKGFWNGITVFSDENQNILDYVIVEYGGGEARGFGLPKTNIGVDGGDRLKIKNSTIRESDGYGLYFDGGIVQEFESNHFVNNNGAPLSLTASEVSSLDNVSTYSNNTNQYIEIQGSTLNETTESVWPVINDGTPYRVSGNVTIDTGLSIEAGSIYEFNSNIRLSIEDSGYITAIGTSSDKITFRGADQSVGFWMGIQIFTNDVNNQFDHCIFENGGSEARGFGLAAANLAIDDGDRVSITNCQFNSAEGYGLFLEGGSTLNGFENNIFSNNTGFPIGLDANNVDQLDEASIFNDGNGDNSVEIFSSDLDKQGQEVSWKALSNDTPYYLNGSQLTIESGLVIEDGVEIEAGTDNQIQVSDDGYLVADGGSEGISIIGKTPAPGAWQGISIFTNDVRNLLNNVTVSHGGSSDIGFGIPQVNIGVDGGGRLTVTNCTITDCDGTGLFGESGSNVTESGNTFNDNNIDIELN